MRSMCIVLLRISIEQGQRSPPHLLLLSTLRSASDDGGTQRSQVCSRLAAACKVKDVRQGVSEYFEGFKAPEEAMVYICPSRSARISQACPKNHQLCRRLCTLLRLKMWKTCTTVVLKAQFWTKNGQT